MSKLKYGNIGLLGEPRFTLVVPMYASSVLSAASGRYVVQDVSDTYWRIATTNEAAISGYIEQHLTCSSTSGNTRLSCATNVNEFACELPYSSAEAAATLTAALLEVQVQETGDIWVTSNIQKFDAAGTQDILRVVGGDVAENTVYCVVPDAKILHID